jgi:hypothetical protein
MQDVLAGQNVKGLALLFNECRSLPTELNQSLQQRVVLQEVRPALSELEEKLLVVLDQGVNEAGVLVAFIESLDELLMVVLHPVAPKHLQTEEDLFVGVLVEYLSHDVAEGAQTGLGSGEQLGLLLVDVLVLTQNELLVVFVLPCQLLVYLLELLLPTHRSQFGQGAPLEDLGRLNCHQIGGHRHQQGTALIGDAVLVDHLEERDQVSPY